MKPYEPCSLPLEGLNYQRLFATVGDASAALARYDGLLQGIVNPSVMLSPLTNEDYESMKKQIHEITHSQYTVHLLDAIFDRPIFDSRHLSKHTTIPATSIKTLIPKLKQNDILTEIRPARGQQPAILVFGELIDITASKHVF